jgi:hypothetical protein
MRKAIFCFTGGEFMEGKKTPERFTIQFDPGYPDHAQAIKILNGLGRH